MKTGFIMVNYNDYENVEKMLNMIGNYSILDKIVIVDNASTDGSLEKLQKLQSDKVVVLKNNRNGGYGSGINVGAKYLNELYPDCYIVVSNTDIIIDCEQDIRTLLNSFDNETAVIAPIIREHQGYNRGWKVPTPWKDVLLNLSYVYRFLKPKLIFYPEHLYKQEFVEVDAASGCFFLVRASDLKEADYFDENIFLYYEENVLAEKLKKLKKKTKINTKVEVFHNHSVTIDRYNSHMRKYRILKESQFYFHKHYSHANIVSLFFLKMTSLLSSIGSRIKCWCKK